MFCSSGSLGSHTESTTLVAADVTSLLSRIASFYTNSASIESTSERIRGTSLSLCTETELASNWTTSWELGILGRRGVTERIHSAESTVRQLQPTACMQLASQSASTRIHETQQEGIADVRDAFLHVLAHLPQRGTSWNVTGS